MQTPCHLYESASSFDSIETTPNTMVIPSTINDQVLPCHQCHVLMSAIQDEELRKQPTPFHSVHITCDFGGFKNVGQTHGQCSSGEASQTVDPVNKLSVPIFIQGLSLLCMRHSIPKAGLQREHKLCSSFHEPRRITLSRPSSLVVGIIKQHHFCWSIFGL